MNKINSIFFKKKLSENYYNFKQSENIIKNINLLYLFYFSYKNFLNLELKKIFEKVFPFYSYKNQYIIEFSKYSISYPLKSPAYCINKGTTYYVSIKLELILFNYKILENKILKTKIRKEKIIIPWLPYMTKNSTFIIEGVEKTIVSRFQRAPGIYFLKELRGKKKTFILRLVPDKGTEIDFIINAENVLYLKYKKNKVLLLDILKSFGLSNKEIIYNFYNFLQIEFELGLTKLRFDPCIFLNYKLPYDIINNFNEVIVHKNTIINSENIENIKSNNIEFIIIDEDFLINKQLGCDLYFDNYKFARISQNIDFELLKKINSFKIKRIDIIVYGSVAHSSVCVNLNNSGDFFESLNNFNDFLNVSKLNIFNFSILNYNNDYNQKNFYISDICRKKINYYFKKNSDHKYLDINDIINIIKMIIAFKDGIYKETDILNIGNLKMSTCGDFLKDIFLDFFIKLKKKIENNFFDFKNKKISYFFKISNLKNEIKKFFSISKYCQYLDQLNILSEISHKRKVTFLGVIGVSKKYSGFDSRDLSASHYSRICPVETPEGSNIGLVNSLALLCKVDKNNFLVAPYYKIYKGKISKKWTYLSVEEEFNSFISDPSMFFKEFKNIDTILAKHGDQLVVCNPDIINYVNILPYQMLSITTLLIPFIENNDSNRALMASNMLRQALPLIFPERPLITTGLETLVSYNNQDLILCKDKGIVKYKDSSFILLEKFLNYKDIYYCNYDIYFLIRYVSTNQKTCRIQRASNLNKNLYKGDILIDNNCTDKGELAIGQNVLVAYMPWEGYNFEDSLIVSKKIVIDERYSSLEIIQVDVNIIEISGKPEILTRNIIANDMQKKNLDEYGLIKVGTKIFGGDIVIGKIYPIEDNFKGIDPNHRLLYSVFSENSDFNYQDSSFYMPEKFLSGNVFSLEIYFQKNQKIKGTDSLLLKRETELLIKAKKKKYFFLKSKIKKMLKSFLINKKIFYKKKIKKIKKSFFKKKNMKKILKINLYENKYFKMFEILKKKIKFFFKIYKFSKINIKKKYFKDLPFKVCKIIRIIIISKKQLQVGDKMSGRYGNKGVVSKILPIWQMPYMFNGRSVDIILNPLGVPSRMNIGQLLEVHLGFISLCLSWKLSSLLSENNSFFKIKNLLFKVYNINNKSLKKSIIESYNYSEILNLVNFFKNGFHFYVEPFSNFNENNINYLLELVFSENFLYDLGVSGNKKQISLYDGKTGKKFENKVTVGISYFLKLNHLAEDKIHARDIGPYSMVTQQPLKGKSNKGGQRVGEMEAWALEAYGAFYSLQEMFTIKSDDMLGRLEAYKNIVKSINNFSFNRPETFDVMLKNINSLSLYVRFSD